MASALMSRILEKALAPNSAHAAGRSTKKSFGAGSAGSTRRDGAAKQFGTEWVADYRAAIARDDVDAVVICSENARHKEMTIAAAEAGKHVLCEKPLATTVEDAQAIIRTQLGPTATPYRP